MSSTCMLHFAGGKLRTKVCETERTRTQGLSGVIHLPEGDGMLFVMKSVGPANFWMRNTFIPLDIAFLDPEFMIIEIAAMDPHIGKSSCDGAVGYAVETNSGWFLKHGVIPGDYVTIETGISAMEEMVRETVAEMRKR